MQKAFELLPISGYVQSNILKVKKFYKQMAENVKFVFYNKSETASSLYHIIILENEK